MQTFKDTAGCYPHHVPLHGFCFLYIFFNSKYIDGQQDPLLYLCFSITVKKYGSTPLTKFYVRNGSSGHGKYLKQTID